MNPLTYPGLTFRQTEFCRHYALGCSAQQAANKAGYSRSFAEHKAYRLLRTPSVQVCVRAFLQAGQVSVPDSMAQKALQSLDRILTEGQNENAVVSAARLLLREKRLSPFQTVSVLPLALPEPEEPVYAPESLLTTEQALELVAEKEDVSVFTSIDPTDDTGPFKLDMISPPGDRKALAEDLSERMDEETRSPDQVERDRKWKETLARRQARYERTGSFYGPNGEDSDD